MRRPLGTVVTSLVLALVADVGAQEQDLPPGATSKVLDIVFRVESFGAKSEDLKVRETDLEVRLELAADVLFDFDKATLRPDAEATLTKAAAFIKEKATGLVGIEGHTDSKGDDAYNRRLSERRADSVRRWFAGHGLGGQKFSIVGLGESRPVAANAKPDGSDDPEGRQRNRRVEIVIGKR